ncbi:MAG: hypothetical protein KBS96_03340 [Lachnospiraceae bacterium]|nr:hypothetical protein [Candidatus Colinaster scatohippi]
MTQKGADKNSILIKVLPYLLAFMGTWSFRGILALRTMESIAYTNSILAFFIFIGSAYILNRIVPEFVVAGKRKQICSAVFSVLFSMAMQFGARMESAENVRIMDFSLWISIVAMALTLMPVVNSIWDRLDFLVVQLFDKGSSEKEKKPFNIYQIWAILLLLWLPTMLALYPGAFVYDAQEEYIEVISRTFTMHHPLLHVLLLGGIIHAAEYIGWTANTGIAIYVILQMTVLSGIFAYSIKLLEKWGLKKVALALVMAFYAFFPLFPLYSVCTAKDTLFTGFFLLVVLLLVNLKSGSFFMMKEMLLFVISSVLMMLLRNNGLYAYIVAIPFIYIILVKEKNKSIAAKTAILMLLSVLLFFGGNLILKTATGAESNEHQEMLTVPIQQISRVYTYSKDVFTDEDIEILHEVIPEEYLVTYNLRISDVLKSGFDNYAYESNPSRYRALWLRIGLKKPMIYLNAWLGTSYGYWYPDAINNVYKGNQMYTFQYGDSSYFGFETEPPGERDSKFKVLELFYRNMSLNLFQQKVPVVSMLFSPGFVFWLFMLIFFMIIRERKNIVPLIPVLLLWLTVLLGPTTIVRYVLILWFIIPLYPILFGDNKKGN